MTQVSWQLNGMSFQATRQRPKARKQYGRVLGRAPGSIIVMHANGRGWHTAEALPLLIEDLRKRGFQFSTVGELLARGQPVIADSCYELKPGDNAKYDKLFPLERPADSTHRPAGTENATEMKAAKLNARCRRGQRFQFELRARWRRVFLWRPQACAGTSSPFSR